MFFTNNINFTDDNFVLTFHKNKQEAVSLMERELNLITTWLTDSGLKVNESKTESCLFYRKDSHPVEITINNTITKSKDHMNVLGVTFDSKLNWSKHVADQISKSNKALHAIKMIKKILHTIQITFLINIQLLFDTILQL